MDSRKIKPYMKVCNEMLKHNSELSNRHRFAYIFECIFNEFNHNNSLGILQMIEDNRKMLDWEGVIPKQRNQIKYL